MYLKWLPLINSKTIILASQSPRRKELLTELGLKFTCHKSDFPENISKNNISPKDYVKQTCEGKFNYFLSNQKIPCDILITADSIVEFKDRIIEKPKSKQELKTWLREFSNNTLIAYTHMVIGIIENNMCKGKRSFTVKTEVFFDKLSEDLIDNYANSDEPYDKAGGFGIQSVAKSFIKGINGDFYNVVGLPVNEFSNNLAELCEEFYIK